MTNVEQVVYVVREQADELPVDELQRAAATLSVAAANLEKVTAGELHGYAADITHVTGNDMPVPVISYVKFGTKNGHPDEVTGDAAITVRTYPFAKYPTGYPIC